MRILVAEDDAVTREALDHMLGEWGYSTTVTCNGVEAWEALRQPDSPSLALLDWLMPEMDGVEVCRHVRKLPQQVPCYILMLTVKGQKAAIVEGLSSGANDYVTKPFDAQELRARLQVGQDTLRLQQRLADQVVELQEAMAQIKQLRGLLPICSYCKNIRDDQNYWLRVEDYIRRNTDAHFSHCICPPCFEKEIAPLLKRGV